MVWQTNRNGNWDIYSKFCNFTNGNGWGSDEPVCTDSADDVNPVVACCNDWWVDHPSYWCVWERRESPVVGSIWASSMTFRDEWGPPESIGRYIHTSGDSAEPGIIVIGHDTLLDTCWVTWTCHDTDGWRIEYSYNAGDSWAEPMIAIAQADPIHHARLGRGHHRLYYGCPLLVWETNGDVFYSEYLSGSWQVPQEVAHAAGLDRSPDVVSFTSYPFPMGPWITWESTRDGDTAIYGTAADTFSIGRRWCDSSGAGSNFTPCGTPAAYTADQWWMLAVAWASDRNGNPDIYSRTLFSEQDVPIDSDFATDINPTLTTFGVTMNWCVWQSNRTGNWDLFGSYIYVTGVEETPNAEVRMVNAPTIVRGVLRLPVSPFAIHTSLFDMTGRQVMALHSGPNDVSRLAPGVYFVRAVSRELSAADCHKVVIAR
jgi:hypothetical protein